MVKFHKISQIEHGEYPFEDAVVDVDVLLVMLVKVNLPLTKVVKR